MSINYALVRVNVSFNLQQIFSQVVAFFAGSFGTRFHVAGVLEAIADSLGESRAGTASLWPWLILYFVYYSAASCS